MNKFFLSLILSFASIALLGQDSKYYLRTAAGASFGNNEYKGYASNIGVGYNINRFLSAELEFNCRNNYSRFMGTESNNGLSLLAHFYPLAFQNKHVIDLSVGFGMNGNRWLQILDEKASISFLSMRERFYVPVFGAGYCYSFEKFDLGLFYRYQAFSTRFPFEEVIYDYNVKNNQILLSIKRSF